jgi:serine/threonine-protein kinase
MAVVWAARLKGALGFQKLVALKSMLPGLSEDRRIEEMFLDEARFASLIKHPHVCSVLDLGEHDGALYLVMEWVDGETVSALDRASRDKGGFPIALATRVVIDAAAGLHAAHELESDSGDRIELVHRDVSPQNILVTRDGVVKIVDFGVAKAIAQGLESHTDAGLVKGKFAFMSPEQADAGTIDRRSDVFALGLVLYQLITGSHPFRCESPKATLDKIKTAAVTPPSTLVPACPASLSDAVMKAVEKDPGQRFSTMVEFARALARSLADIPEADRREDLADFVARVSGERIEKRRATIKEAIRVADERRRSAQPAAASPTPPADEPTLVSEPTLTSVQTGVSTLGRRSTTSDSAAPFVVPPSRPASRALVTSILSVTAVLGVALAAGLFFFLRAGAAPNEPVEVSALKTQAAAPIPDRVEAAAALEPAAAPNAQENAPKDGRRLADDGSIAPRTPRPAAVPLSSSPMTSAAVSRAQSTAHAAAAAPPAAAAPGRAQLPTVREPGF